MYTVRSAAGALSPSPRLFTIDVDLGVPPAVTVIPRGLLIDDGWLGGCPAPLITVMISDRTVIQA